MKTEGERISDIISHFCESKADFARKMEESPQTISNWVSRGAGKKCTQQNFYQNSQM